jgi:N-acetyl-gamma-glutamyl-phosphate reductase
MTRGILATCYAQSSGPDVSAAACVEAARALYADSPSVHVLDVGQHPDTLWVRGSNRVHLAYTQDPNSGTLIAMSAIDNLVKGASGQAIQCLNIRFDLDEAEGLKAPAQWP